MKTALLQTKLHIPSARKSIVSRPRLVDKLSHGLNERLTLVSASAGYGKTTAIAAWLQEAAADQHQVCWLSLDEGDNNPTQFWSYVIAAMQTAAPQLATKIGPLLRGGQVTDFFPLLIDLINEVATTSQRFILVLDDYHVIQSHIVHETVDYWLTHLPPQIHVVISSRSDPPLSLPRWRARGQMTELRDADLRFTTEEAVAFLNQVMDLGLAEDDIATLEKRTEGWIASLQLAALAMQSSSVQASTPHDFVTSFAGSDRYIVDYLVEEVLDQQPPHIQTFLLHTSILDRLCGPLCDALLAEDELSTEDSSSNTVDDSVPARDSSSQQILEFLDTINLFLVPLDNQRQWYRYHHLFRELLRFRLEAVAPEHNSKRHLRASGWLHQNGFIEDAIDHALLAEDHAYAADLLEPAAHGLFSNGKMPKLKQWMAQLPPHFQSARPRLYMLAGWLLFRTGQFDRLDSHLQNPPAPESLVDTLAEEYLVLRANNAFAQGDFDTCRQLAIEVRHSLPADNVELRMPVTTVLAWSYESSGDLATAIHYHKEAAAIGQEANVLSGTIASLAMLIQNHAQMGELTQAREYYAQVQQVAKEHDIQWIPLLGPAYIGVGHVDFQQGKVDDAIQHLQEGIRRCRQWGGLSIAAMRGYAILTQLFHQEKMATEEQRTLAEARSFAQTSNIPAWAADLSSILNVESRLADSSSQTAASGRSLTGLPIATPSILLDPLTARERDVLRLLVAGHLSPQIAEELIVSVSTVRTHIKRIYNKLDVHSRSEAIQRAVELSLV